MREILFRGKRADNGEWVEGYYTKKLCGEYINNQFMESEKDFIITYFSSGGITSHEVIPESVGQYTGLTDKHGTKIFEGDITDEGIIEYWEGKYVVMQSNGQCWDDLFWCYNKIEVLGNVHDNPELLGGDDNDNHT